MRGKTGNNAKTTVSSEVAETLLQEGWKKMDLHVHSSCSYDVPPVRAMHPAVLFEKARSKGLDFVTFTDHDTVKAYDLLGWEREGLVPGVEISLNDPEHIGHTLHVNVFELDSEEFRELELIANQERDFKSFIRYLRTHDLPHMYNHPFQFAIGDRPNLWAVPELIKQFPVVEYNMQNLTEKNLITAALARKYGKGLVATTDSHTGGMGAVYTLAKGETFREFFENVKKGRSYIVVEGGARRHITKELNSWIELVFTMDRQLREDLSFTTKVPSFDRVISLFANDRIKDFPRINSLAMKFFQNFSRSGLPAYMYIRAEKPMVSRIEKILNQIA
ncbi:PHP domain-containing protein [Methanosarcina sp.]|uniref:PHP domain-containing protein n=1 Tax=Methanosarcina sp. TaxID=2213 RepID=UPI003C776FBD